MSGAYCTRCDQRFIDANDENRHVESFGHPTTHNPRDRFRPSCRNVTCTNTAASSSRLLMGYCSRICMIDHLCEDDVR